MGAGVGDILLGRSDAERTALLRLIEREDEIFRLQPGEDSDPTIHARVDLARFQLINARMKLMEATSERKSDRNFYATIILGVAILLKSGVSWTEVFKFFAGVL